MAQRRMFSLKVIDTDEFLDMPMSSQFLYFNLSMRADDDGFVGNPKKIMRMTGCNDDDFKVLNAKKFIIPFENGICVIRHWRIHNYIQSDRYQETQYLDEKASLTEKNGCYLKENQECIQNVYKMDTQVRLGKVRLGNNTAEKIPQRSFNKEIIDYFFNLKGWDIKNPPKRTYQSFLRCAKDLLEICEGNLEDAKEKINKVKEWADSRELDWSLETIFKKWYDLPHLKAKEKKPYYEGLRMFKGMDDRWRVVEKNGDIKIFNDSENKIIYK